MSKIFAIKTIDQLLESPEITPAPLVGEWWRPYRGREPVTGQELRDLAEDVIHVALHQVVDAANDAEAEQHYRRALRLSKAILAKAVKAEIEAKRGPGMNDPVKVAAAAPHLYSTHLSSPTYLAPDRGSEPPGGKSYKALFGQPADTGGFASFGDFLRVVVSERWDPRLETKWIAGLGPQGGFAVPEVWVSFLFDAMVQASAILPRARVVPMQALQVHIPAWDDLNQADGSVFGGFTGQWLAEGAAAAEQTGKVRMLTLRAKKLAIYTSVSRELLLGTGQAFESELRTALTRAVAAKLDEAFLRGTDAMQPQGILTAPALKTVTRGTANDVTYTDLAKVFAALHPAFADRCTWFISPTVLPRLLLMADASGRLIWQPSGREATPTTLFGRPVVFTDRLPTLGQQGDVLLVADGGYVVGMAQQITVDTSNAPAWSRDLVSLRCVVLADGMLSWNQVYTAPDHTTYSTAVALA